MSNNISRLSKAETLEFLMGEITGAHILPLLTVSFHEWISTKESVLSNIHRKFKKSVIIRSSSQNEDLSGYSNAGVFLSIQNVAIEREALTRSIDAVFSSYGEPKPEEHLFIQEMIESVETAGVAFSHDPNSGAPYYVINYDHTGKTDNITSGSSKESETCFLMHGKQSSSVWLNRLARVIDELRGLFGCKPIDVEFAVLENKIYILQVRELTIAESARDTLSEPDFQLELRCIQKKLHRLTQKHPYLLGSKTLYGVMPDWNPAEIIGIKPTPLALSLYKELVTNEVWSIQRANYGYRNTIGCPLITVLGGTPFVDVRASFNSFVPESLEEKLAEQLINYYLNKLEATPELHDKVEFEVVMSCFTFDLHDKLSCLPDTFDKAQKSQIKDALISLTNSILRGFWKSDLDKIEQLRSRHASIINSDLNKIDKIYWLIQDCKNFGTLPFAGLARCGFIAVQLLNSLVSKGLVTASEASTFMSNLETISSQFIDDKSLLDEQSFIAKYGHLRPGTYDINSARYDEEPQKYLRKIKARSSNPKKNEFNISLQSLNSINSALSSEGVDIDAVGLLNFIKEAIEAREFSKFVFTRNLSDSLYLIEKLGSQIDISRSDMAYADISDILKLYSTSLSANQSIKSSIALGKKYHQLSLKIKLPSLLRSVEEVFSFKLMREEPNFVTQLEVTGKILLLTKNSQYSDIEGKIVFIESADPGYDWLFDMGIIGLVTCFGGKNSHMAIRANELEIPSIIGAGEKNYNEWSQNERLSLDCLNQKVSYGI